MGRTRSLCAVAVAVAILTGIAGGEYSWQKPHAKVLPQGDLEWAPEPFEFQPGDSVRYIDYENGDDNADGTTPRTAWKHHPWDPAARDVARAGGDADTYVFKQGSVYRGTVRVPAGASAYFTRDPNWGSGEAAWYGSEVVTGWKKGAHPDMPGGQTVWRASVDFLPRCAWVVADDGSLTRLKLARTPNWEVSDPDNVLSEWWTWDQPEWWKAFSGNDPNSITADGKKWYLGIDKDRLGGLGDWVIGGVAWTEFGIPTGNMPTPVQIHAYDPERKGVAFGSMWNESHGGPSCMLYDGHRYFLEDRPQWLDEPGEFWVDRQGHGGTLYMRLPNDADPNSVTIEAGRHVSLIDAAESGRIGSLRVSGLTFRFMNVNWEYTAPQYMDGDQRTGVVRVKAAADRVGVDHCLFEHVNCAVWVEAVPFIRAGTGERPERQLHNVVEHVAVTDNQILHTDHEAVFVTPMRHSPAEPPRPQVRKVEVLRNRLEHIGFRASRGRWNQGMYITGVRQYHVAGNMVRRIAGSGMFCSLAKGDGKWGETPFARGMIHHNKSIDPLLTLSDFGGIQSNDNGPAYLWSNIVGNPGGIMYWQYKPDSKEDTPRFGHAFYFDGNVMKRHMFNNIAWGGDNEPGSLYACKAGVQQFCSMNTEVFNNTFYRFVQGLRRQTIQGARSKYIGNLLVDMSEYVFHDSKPPKTRDPNAPHVFEEDDPLDYATLAYKDNAIHNVGGVIGVFEKSGFVHEGLDGFETTLGKLGARASDAGTIVEENPLPGADDGDFRPAPSLRGRQAHKVFVPWALHGVVGEWSFAINNEDPTRVIDEHNYLTNSYFRRKEYWRRPYYPLTARGVGDADYVTGELETWTRGALELDGKGQHLVLPQETLAETLTFDVGRKGGGTLTVRRQDKKTVDIRKTNFLVEAYFRVAGGDAGVLVRKMDDEAGYALTVRDDGKVAFQLRSGGRPMAERLGSATVADGEWHHLIAEANRDRPDGLHIYIDGKPSDGHLSGSVNASSLANSGDFLVAGGPDLDGLTCSLDFLRVAHGTLADAETNIEELYAWEFDGPFLNDFAGRRRDFTSSAPGAVDF